MLSNLQTYLTISTVIIITGLIGDESKAYLKALLLRGKYCYFFCHKHSHPWKYSQRHKFEVFVYGRVSASKQKDDLKRQIDSLKDHEKSFVSYL